MNPTEVSGIKKPGKWYHVNTSAIPAKIAYFMIGITEGVYTPYINLFLINTGLTPSQAGVISGFSMLCWFCGALTWGMVADWCRKYGLILFLVSVGATSVTIPLPFVPGIIKGYGNSSCNNATGTTNSTNINQVPCPGSPDNMLFYTMLIMYPAIMFFDVYLQVFTDTMVMRQVSASENTIDYGRTRLFFPIGYGVGAFVTSTLFKIKVAGINIAKFSLQCITLYPMIIMLLLTNAHFLLKHVPKEKKKEGQTNGKMLRVLKETICQFHVLFFLATVYVLGMMDGLHINFVLVLMREHNAEEILLGLTVAAGMISGIAFYIFSTRLITFVGGPFPMMAISLFAGVLRFAVYGYMTSPYAFLIIQITKGLCLSAFVTAAMMHTENVAPQEVKSTMFGLVHGLILGGGHTTANIAGGAIFQKYGGQNMYKGAALLCCFWGILVFSYVLWSRNKSCHQEDGDEIILEELDETNEKLYVKDSPEQKEKQDKESDPFV